MSRTIIIPLHDVSISSDYGEELRIDRVTLISSDKISRLRSRFGISRVNWRRLHEKYFSETSKSATTIALLRDSSNKQEEDVVRDIEDELHILHLIQLPISEKSLLRAWAPYGASLQLSQQHYVITDSGLVGSRGRLKNGVIFPLELDRDHINERHWKHFRTLTRALREPQFSAQWRRELRRAMILLGRSLTENSAEIAFLLGCIGLESLLICNEANHREQLLRAVFLFSGSRSPTGTISLETQFDEAYDKRCRFVHRGQADDITLKDARVVQEILFNVISNIATQASIFRSKQEVSSVYQKIHSARQLGIEMKYWPKTMTYRRCVTIARDDSSSS